ncbi:endonuclease III, partial [Pandoraea nosoerga]|uniref:endonuclease III domain-containing protein n=1 Tax=Pandoraea nosoerga TaxID=2508296 RepID=UPI003B8A5FE4|nr:endonuclease III [Pandoraea nosoerga]
MKKQDVFEFFSRLAADNPHPETELEYVNDYTLLVAVVLSAQATDAGVNKATRARSREADTPEKRVARGEAGLKRHIKTSGLFNTRAKNVIALPEALIRDQGGQVPADRDALEQ